MRSRLPRPLARLQDRLATLLGSGSVGRSALVASMLRRDASEATAYWLQLCVSVGIATMGLVLGSSAVVIGAMLVAPLMGPIVALGLGLAAGSPVLVLRSAGRVALSTAIACAASALITLALPFHQLSAELAARTAPTALDLVTAAFCALAGVYAAIRPGSDTTTTAAGTSIGISLVPPLCTSGYGLGTGDAAVAGGAALLFLTNFVAIVVVATAAFVLLGFNRVDVVTLEGEELGKGEDVPVVGGLTRRLSLLFASRWGPWLRFMMPFLLLAVVYIPLRSALDDVAWQVRVRSAVASAIAALPPRVVHSRVRVEHRDVEVALVILGSTADAESARVELDGRIRELAGIPPRVEVLAVPDAAAFAGLQSSLLSPAAAAPAPVVVPPAPLQMLQSSRDSVAAAVKARWPAAAAGEPVSIELGVTGPELVIRVAHFGAPLEAAAREAVERSLAGELQLPVVLRELAVPAGELRREVGGAELLPRLASGLAAAEALGGISVCVTEPPPPPPPAKRRTRDTDPGDTAVRLLLDRAARVSRTSGDAWRIRFVQGACEAVTTAVGAEPGAQEH